MLVFKKYRRIPRTTEMAPWTPEVDMHSVLRSPLDREPKVGDMIARSSDQAVYWLIPADTFTANFEYADVHQPINVRERRINMTRDEEENAVKILATDIGVDRLIELAGRLKRDTSGSDKFKEVSAELDAAIDAELSEHTSIMTDETDTQAAMGHKAHK